MLRYSNLWICNDLVFPTLYRDSHPLISENSASTPVLYFPCTYVTKIYIFCSLQMFLFDLKELNSSDQIKSSKLKANTANFIFALLKIYWLRSIFSIHFYYVFSICRLEIYIQTLTKSCSFWKNNNC